jgi:uncharacterized membrane protein
MIIVDCCNIVRLQIFAYLHFNYLQHQITIYAQNYHEAISPFCAILSGAFSAYFVYLQLVVIEAICPFCMVSVAETVTLLSL